MLAAYQDVFTAFHHVAGAAAVLIGVAQAVSFQIVDEDAAAAFDRDPGVRPAASRVNAAVGDAQRRPAVHLHIGRTGLRGADAFVRAVNPVMGVLGNEGTIAEPRLGLHMPIRNISRRGRFTWH